MKHFSKKGVIQQAFVYALSAIFIIVILLFGYSVLSDVNETTSSAKSIAFKTELTNDIEVLSEKFGAMETNSYSLPDGYTKVCFVEPSRVNTGMIDNQVINDSVRNGLDENMFMFGDKSLVSMYIDGLSLKYNPYYACRTFSDGQMELKMQGRGNKALLLVANENICKTAEDEGFCSGLDLVIDKGYKSSCCKNYGMCC